MNRRILRVTVLFFLALLFSFNTSPGQAQMPESDFTGLNPFSPPGATQNLSSVAIAALAPDDLSTTYGWSFESDFRYGYLGYALASAGDVNGDGYTDLIAAAPEYDGPLNREGRVFVFYGSPSGPGSTPDWTADGELEDLEFGTSVAGVGDVNGDDFDDIIIGTPYYRDREEDGQEGGIFVYYGSANGLDPDGSRPVGTPDNADWMAQSNDHNANLGMAVETAGDVNGDGYDDIIVGAPYYVSDSGTSNRGAVFVYHGSEDGLDPGGARPSGDPTNADWWATGGGAYHAFKFGQAVGTAGDVDGDGFDDIIVGAPNYNHEGSVIYEAGSAYVFHGSETGLDAGDTRPTGSPENADWWAHSGQGNAHFGSAVGTAGDINDDGADEVIVGALHYEDDAGTEGNEGWAFVYYGHDGTGLSAASDWTGQSNQRDAYYGTAVGTAGDVNGDGYDDILIGAEAYDDTEPGEGAVFVYYGSGSGLGPDGTPDNADWTGEIDKSSSRLGNALAAAGDVNGDTCPDVIAGAREFTGFVTNETKEGGIFLFFGTCDADWSDAPDPAYPTLLTSNGARHRITDLYLGTTVDADTDGQPDADALGDDSDSDGDDEDGIIVTSDVVRGEMVTLQVTTSAAGKLNAWIDFDSDGDWEGNEQIFINEELTAGDHPLSFTIPITAVPGDTSARFRLSKDAKLGPTGPTPYGEVEDYQLMIEDAVDWGDAPDPAYPTLAASDGASHSILGGYYLGEAVDHEADGQPSDEATGDDDDSGGDDEDGVIFSTLLVAGEQACLRVALTNDAGIGLPYLDAWIDFNGDRLWNHPDEHLWGDESQVLSVGGNLICFDLPATANAGWTYARFRLSDNGDLAPTGHWENGEVEDYKVFIGKTKWSQPPETNHDSDFPMCFWGWDQFSTYDSPPPDPPLWENQAHVMADDWPCSDDRPVTGIHWWGSYVGWDSGSPPPPELGPAAFHIGIWTDVEATPPLDPFSHPGQLIHAWSVPRSELNERAVACDYHPGTMLDADTCYRYDFAIAEAQWFYQDPNENNMYWISIAAVYDPPYTTGPVWGWQTRPSVLNDPAVRIFDPIAPMLDDPFVDGSPLDLVDEASWDMTFSLSAHMPPLPPSSSSMSAGPSPDGGTNLQLTLPPTVELGDGSMANVDGYYVYEAASPYFTPQGIAAWTFTGPFGPDQPFILSDQLGNPDQNHYYKVQSFLFDFFANEVPSTSFTHFAEFDFGLNAGSQPPQ